MQSSAAARIAARNPVNTIVALVDSQTLPYPLVDARVKLSRIFARHRTVNTGAYVR